MSKPVKQKIHVVEVKDHSTHYVMAQTRQGAIRDVTEHLRQKMTSRVATGSDMYDAGRYGIKIIGVNQEEAVDERRIEIEYPLPEPNMEGHV